MNPEAKGKLKSPYILLPALLLSVTVGVVAWGFYQPKVFLFVCKGNINVHTLPKEDGKVKKDKFYQNEHFLKVYEYFWGANYTLEGFTREDCITVKDFGEVVFCSRGEHGALTYRYAEFNLDTGKLNYEWTADGTMERTTYRSDDLGCMKIQRAIDK